MPTSLSRHPMGGDAMLDEGRSMWQHCPGKFALEQEEPLPHDWEDGLTTSASDERKSRATAEGMSKKSAPVAQEFKGGPGTSETT